MTTIEPTNHRQWSVTNMSTSLLATYQTPTGATAVHDAVAFLAQYGQVAQQPFIALCTTHQRMVYGADRGTADGSAATPWTFCDGCRAVTPAHAETFLAPLPPPPPPPPSAPTPEAAAPVAPPPTLKEPAPPKPTQVPPPALVADILNQYYSLKDAAEALDAQADARREEAAQLLKPLKDYVPTFQHGSSWYQLTASKNGRLFLKGPLEKRPGGPGRPAKEKEAAT